MHDLFTDFYGQGWTEQEELGIAFVLSALIGVEREYRQKSAGLRTYTIVGLSCALMMLVSKYGFTDSLQNGRGMPDPSRIAAQIVSGIGFIGGGVIFMRRDAVRGLTTAAIIWLTAGIGMACGAGLVILACTVTIWHFIIVFVFPAIASRLPRAAYSTMQISLIYEGGHGVLRSALTTCTRHGFSVSGATVQNQAETGDNIVNVVLVIQGTGNPKTLVETLGRTKGALSVHASDYADPLNAST
jgi:putative Mg2+ transporter-C (MgtC) family protein